jgi:hypothetical protein
MIRILVLDMNDWQRFGNDELCRVEPWLSKSVTQSEHEEAR